MKKLILLLTLVAVSFSADKWEYAMAEYNRNIELIGAYEAYKKYSGNREEASKHISYKITEIFTVFMLKSKTDKYNSYISTEYANKDELTKVSNEKYYNVYLTDINKMGEDGWELISLEKDETESMKTIFLYFKRKIG